MVSVAAVCGWMSAVINREVEEGLCTFVMLFLVVVGGSALLQNHYYSLFGGEGCSLWGAEEKIGVAPSPTVLCP